MGQISNIPHRINNGSIISSNTTISVFQAGTSTLVSLFSDEALASPASNPFAVTAGNAIPILYYGYTGKIRVEVVDASGTLFNDDPYDRPVYKLELGSTVGGAMVGTSRGNAVENELTWARTATPASIHEFYDASNGAAAERMALEAAAASGRAVSWRGTLTMDQAPSFPVGTVLIGEGSTSDNNIRGNSCIVRGFAGAGPLLVIPSDMVMRNIDVDGDGRGTGDNIKIVGERAILDNISTRKAGGNGIRIGDDNNDKLNANCWQISALKAIYNKGDGIYIHHTNGDNEGSFPLGAPNVNSGCLFGGDIRSNDGHGLHLGNSLDNKFFGATAQHNKMSNVYWDVGSLGNSFFSLYSEAGYDPDTFVAGSKGNLILGTQVAVQQKFVNGGDGNIILAYEANAKIQQFRERLAVGGVIGGSVGGFVDLYDEQAGLGAQIYTRQTGVGTQAKGIATAKRNGNTPIDIFEWADGDGINILSGGVRVGGVQVLGSRYAGVPVAASDPTSTQALANWLRDTILHHGLGGT